MSFNINSSNGLMFHRGWQIDGTTFETIWLQFCVNTIVDFLLYCLYLILVVYDSSGCEDLKNWAAISIWQHVPLRLNDLIVFWTIVEHHSCDDNWFCCGNSIVNWCNEGMKKHIMNCKWWKITGVFWVHHRIEDQTS
jgi:hypothetical protein